MAKQIRSGIHMDPVVLVNSPARQAAHRRRLPPHTGHRHAGREPSTLTSLPRHGSWDWETEMHGSKKSSRALQLVDFALEDPERRTLLGLELRELAHTDPSGPAPSSRSSASLHRRGADKTVTSR